MFNKWVESQFMETVKSYHQNNMSKELIDKLLKASETIHKSSIKGSANYMVVSPYFSNYFKISSRKEKIKRLFPDE